MATNFNPATKISVSGPLSISDKRSADMPLDIRGRIETLTDITTIPFAWEGMLVYVRDTKKYYKVTSLANRTVGGVTIPYYPATWVEFGSGGSTPSPTPSEIDAGNVSYFSSGTFSNNTVGKELQSLANDILSLVEDIHNLSGDIGTLSNLDTENKQDLVSAINEVLASTVVVVDNLLSNSTTDALSAYQGKVLKGLIDGKVAGIKVLGESGVLPMDSNGIVTIPAGGGGGTGTITGATVGGNPVTASGGILQFDAYIIGIKDSNGNDINPDSNGKVTLPVPPSVPITKIRVEGASNDLPTDEGRVVIPSSSVKGIQTNNGTALSPNASGIVTLPVIPADQSSRIKKIEDTILQIGNQEPIVVPSTAINLPTSDSFQYDSDNTYVINIDNTQIPTVHYPYTTNNVNYVVFKAIDRDLYYVYSVTSNVFTYVNSYTWSNLPSDAKAKFESGIYAVKQVINNDGSLPEGYWKHGVPSVFVSRHGYPLRYRQIQENNIDANDNGYHILIKHDEINKIFKYRCYTSIPSSSSTIKTDRWYLANVYVKDSVNTGAYYESYDKYFDTGYASNIYFDDSIAHLGTQENPITNVQAAINAAVTGFASNQSILIVKIVEYNGNPLSNIECTIGYTLNGESESFTETTNANGYLYATLPYGAVYTVNYPTRINRQTPASSTGVADSIHVNIFAVYSFSSDYEILNLQILLKGASTTLYPLTNAIVNIDFLASDGTVTIPDARVCTIGATGRIASCIDNNGVTHNQCTIPRSQKYKIKLSAWTDFDKTDDLTYTAEYEVRDVLMYYIYKLSGQYLVIEDYVEGVDQNTYTEYKIINFDPVENKITIVDNEDVQWDVVKNDATGNVVRSIAGADNYSLWIPSANFDRVLGIGIRTTDLMDLQQSSIGVDDVPSKFKDSCFIVTNELITGFAFETSSNIWDGHPRSNSGLLNTKAMAYCETYTYPLSQAYFGLQGSSNARTKKFGQYTLQGFMCSPMQARAIYANQSVLKIVGNMFNLTDIVNFTYNIFGASFDYGYNNNAGQIWSLGNGSGPIYSPAWAKALTNYKHFVIYPF